MAPAPHSNGSLFINLLGGFRAAGPQAKNLLVFERRKTRALLAVLAVDQRREMSRGKLTALLWADQSEDVARHSLRQCLLDLRHALSKANVDAIRADGDLISLQPSCVVVDVASFERLTNQSTTNALNQAMALYQGDLLEGFSLEEQAFEDWLQIARERLRSRAVQALRKLLGDRVRAKATEDAIHIGIRMLTFEPFDETVHRTLMRLYAESGRRSTALRQYEACVELLSRELRVEPEVETRDLYRRLVSERGDGPKPHATARAPRKPTSRVARTLRAYRSAVGTPLVGREADLGWLEALWQRASQGDPQLALILGDAGIGKSRLVGELASRVQDRSIDFLLGRGREGEDVLAFAPWVEALRPVLSQDIVERLPAVTRRDLARLFPEIADGPGPLPTGIEDGPRIFEAVAHLLRLLANAHGLAVVIEDLHWCDDMTVRLLRFLPRRLQDQAVLLLGTARLEETACSGRAALLDALRSDASCVARTVGPLSRDDATRLFLVLLPSRDKESAATWAERVWTISEGNPFVVVECARAVRDRGSINSHYSMEVPQQVRALTARWLATLSDRAAHLADVAAVIGRNFEVALLRHAAGFTELDVADGVEELVRRRFLSEVDTQFAFSHDRVREVAYGRLLGPRRTLLHRQVAEALEMIYADDVGQHCAAIGAHYRQAGVWQKVSEYQMRAGFQAWERGASRAASTCFQDALDALTRLPPSQERRDSHARLRVASDVASVAISIHELGRSDSVPHQSPQIGGVLRVAHMSEPPTLDIPWGTAQITSIIMRHVNEGLFIFDNTFRPIPLLADSHTVSDTGLRHTINLRKNVRFHNGDELTSADVVASLTRWGRVASLGKLLWENVARVDTPDTYTVVLTLRQPSSSLISGLAETHAVIYPTTSIEAADGGELKEFIGTGPYRLVEHQPHCHVRLARFTDYAARSEPPSGFGGRKTAYLDEIFFIPVPDPVRRLAGVETGEYHYGMLIRPDAWDRIRSIPQLEPRIVTPHAWVAIVLNHAQGLMKNTAVRQALQAALDMEPIMAAAFGHRIFYRLDPGLFFPEQPWHSTAGAHLYNQHDRVKAQRLLNEARYSGQPLRWLTTKEYDFMYTTAAVAAQQLESVGFNIDLQVVDWATLNSHAMKPELWDVASTAVTFNNDPGNYLALRCNWWGSWCLEEKEELLRELQRGSDPRKRKEIVDRLQSTFYEDVGRVKIGDFVTLDVARRELCAQFRTMPQHFFWNAWLNV